jgi:galactoside O-acetyltransferase
MQWIVFCDKLESGITIGEKTVVGACALVNCNIPAGATAVGIPCKIINYGGDND